MDSLTALRRIHIQGLIIKQSMIQRLTFSLRPTIFTLQGLLEWGDVGSGGERGAGSGERGGGLLLYSTDRQSKVRGSMTLSL